MGDSKKELDRQRFDRWYQEHGQAVRGYLWAMVRDADLSDDLLQEVFRRAWQARQSYRETGNGRAYLMRIADHLVYDLGRKAHREVNLNEQTWEQCEPASIEPLPEDLLIQNEATSQLNLALETITIDQRRALMLRYYGQLSFREIALQMKCPISTALSHCRRGLLALRDVFSGCLL